MNLGNYPSESYLIFSIGRVSKKSKDVERLLVATPGRLKVPPPPANHIHRRQLAGSVEQAGKNYYQFEGNPFPTTTKYSYENNLTSTY